MERNKNVKDLTGKVIGKLKVISMINENCLNSKMGDKRNGINE